MKTAIVVQHLPFEDLGIFSRVLTRKGYDIQYVTASSNSFGTDPERDYDLAVILGGPISVYQSSEYPWMQAELTWLRKRLAAKAPTLGICFGAQAIASALGADVKRAAPEVGWKAITLTRAGANSPLRHLSGVPVLHWHSDICQLPVNAKCLASTEGTPNQAFCLGRYALGLQFHPEVQWPDLEQWLIAYTRELADLQVSLRKFRAECRILSAALPQASEEMLIDWLSSLD